MLMDTFYFGITRKMVSLFGTLFNDIQIIRTNNAGDETALIKVPISYAKKDKTISRLISDPQLNRDYSVLLPRMSFELTNMTYRREEKLTSTQVIVRKDASDKSKFRSTFVPVPYDFEFTLHIYVKNEEDGTKIYEQILPYFTKDFTPTVNLIPEMDISHDIPVILNSIKTNDNYGEGDYKTNRVITWDLDFTVQGYFYGPVRSTKIIKMANTSFYLPKVPDGELFTAVGNTAPAERIVITPGLTVNGTPTSNSSISIPYLQIEATDDFGFCVDIENL